MNVANALRFLKWAFLLGAVLLATPAPGDEKPTKGSAGLDDEAEAGFLQRRAGQGVIDAAQGGARFVGRPLRPGAEAPLFDDRVEPSPLQPIRDDAILNPSRDDRG